MIVSVFFTSILQNDNGLVNISGVENELKWVLNEYRMINDIFPALYGDEIYVASIILVKWNGAQDAFHDRMTSVRVDAEHFFGSTNSLFKRLVTKHTWKICKMRHYVKSHLFSIFQ